MVKVVCLSDLFIFPYCLKYAWEHVNGILYGLPLYP